MADMIDESTRVGSNESALYESEAKYRRIVETSQEGIWEIDSNSNTTYVNNRIAEMLGYTPEEMLGYPVSFFTYPDDKADQERQLALRRGGQNTNFERRFIRRDGSTLYTQVSATALHDAHGNNIGSFAMLTDISERKLAEQALRESEERFRRLAEGVADIIWTTNAEDRFTYCTPAIKHILGYSQDEILHRQRQEFMQPAELEHFKAMHQQLLATQQSYRHVEYKLRHKDGREVVLESSADPVFDHSGEFSGFRGIDRDITIWKSAQAERERLIEDLSRAVAEIETLHGLLPICSKCKNIRDDNNNWTAIEQYISQRSDINFTHSLCPECMRKLYPDLIGSE